MSSSLTVWRHLTCQCYKDCSSGALKLYFDTRILKRRTRGRAGTIDGLNGIVVVCLEHRQKNNFFQSC